MILARAPLRVSLGGGGTDLPSYYRQYGGFILSAAIDKYVYLYVNRPSADDLIRVKYSKYEEVASVDLIEHDLVRPALKLLELDGNLEIVSMADVPGGTGLGSSGAYLVGLLTALYEFKRDRVPTQALAEAACHIEMDLAGHPVGKHDHYLAAFGGFTNLEIDRDGKVRVTVFMKRSLGSALFCCGELLYCAWRTWPLSTTRGQKPCRDAHGAQQKTTMQYSCHVFVFKSKFLSYRTLSTFSHHDEISH